MIIDVGPNVVELVKVAGTVLVLVVVAWVIFR